jgi:hypothetical protein
MRYKEIKLKNKVEKIKQLFNDNRKSKISMLAIILFISFGFTDSFPKSIQKKIDKELTILWPDSTINLFEKRLDSSRMEMATKMGIMEIYTIVGKDEKLGYMVYLQVPSKFDFFDIAIFYDLNNYIKSIKILAYREDHGGEVGSKRWLKQFIGMGADNAITLNDDIQGISGATISCESATKGAREVTKFMDEFNSKE